MSEIIVKELDKGLIHQANYNSMSCHRGDNSEHDYHVYAQRIQSWPISDEKKQKLLDKLYEKCSKLLSYEAKHVSVMVAGPARYNSKRLDHSDAILRLSAELCQWFNDIEEQVKAGTKQQEDDEAERLVEMIEFCDQRPELDPTTKLAQLAFKDNAKFMELFEKLLPKYRWRKNSTVYKLYLSSKEGKVKEVHREVFFEDGNLTAYRKGDRAFIKFVMRPARQLIVALKSRGWFWNNREDAWSTYLDKVDEEWVSSISERYAKYV